VSPVAFLLLVHDNPSHVDWLSRRLAPHEVYLHVDAKAPMHRFRQTVAAPHVTPVERVDVAWGGFSIVSATMHLLEAALASDAEHFVLLSGACFPIRPIDELVEHLRSAPDCRMRYVPITDRTAGLHGTVRLRWFLELNRHPGGRFARRALHYGAKYALGQRDGVPGGLRPHCGSQWWSLTRPAAELVVATHRRGRELVAFYRTVFAPDEHFVQTVVANSEHARDHHLTRYRGKQSFCDAALHHIRPTLALSTGREGTKPDLLDPVRDAAELRVSGKFFARKLARDVAVADLETLLGQAPAVGSGRPAR
jgi:hypothetical protein